MCIGEKVFFNRSLVHILDWFAFVVDPVPMTSFLGVIRNFNGDFNCDFFWNGNFNDMLDFNWDMSRHLVRCRNHNLLWDGHDNFNLLVHFHWVGNFNFHCVRFFNWDIHFIRVGNFDWVGYIDLHGDRDLHGLGNFDWVVHNDFHRLGNFNSVRNRDFNLIRHFHSVRHFHRNIHWNLDFIGDWNFDPILDFDRIRNFNRDVDLHFIRSRNFIFHWNGNFNLLRFHDFIRFWNLNRLDHFHRNGHIYGHFERILDLMRNWHFDGNRNVDNIFLNCCHRNGNIDGNFHRDANVIGNFNFHRNLNRNFNGNFHLGFMGEITEFSAKFAAVVEFADNGIVTVRHSSMANSMATSGTSTSTTCTE